MARPLRIEYEGALYHVTSRGNAGQETFLDDTDRARFLDVLAQVVERFQWVCHAHCLMTNHYHLLIETPDANLSRGMQHLNSVYTQAFNRYHRRAGHVLQGRFKSILVEEDSHLLELARYVVLNPVRAKMVRSAKDWRWSSYRATAGMVEAPEFLTVSWVLSQFHKDLGRASCEYRKFVQQGRGVDVWTALQHGAFLGPDEFVEGLRPLLAGEAANKEIPRRERLAARLSLDKLFEGANDKKTRNQRIHQAVRAHEYTLKEVGEFIGLSYSTISMIARRIDEEAKQRK